MTKEKFLECVKEKLKEQYDLTETEAIRNAMKLAAEEWEKNHEEYINGEHTIEDFVSSEELQNSLGLK